MRAVGVAWTVLLIAALPARATEFTYDGVCEASAAAVLDRDHFAVASDETNAISVYRRGEKDRKRSIDFEAFTGFDKSDLEGAARVGRRVYWISSHSHTREGKDRDKRKLLFATDIVEDGGLPSLAASGKPFLELRDPLATAAGVRKEELNVEGLAAGEDGALLIGLRAPIEKSGPIVVPLENPAEVVEGRHPPRFGARIPVALPGLGIRSLERRENQARPYLIVAGPVQDAKGPFGLYGWSGRAEDAPVAIQGDLSGLVPEALITFPGERSALVLSDEGAVRRPDGTKCSDEDASSKPAFRSRAIDLPD